MVSKNVLHRVSEKNIKNIESTMSLFIILVIKCLICALPEHFIYISLSTAMWHGIFKNWRITKNVILAQKVNSLKHYTNKQGPWIPIFSREKHISWTIFGLNHHLNNKKVEKSSSCLKRAKNSLERVKQLLRELNYQIIHSRGKFIPLNRWNEVLFL